MVFSPNGVEWAPTSKGKDKGDHFFVTIKCLIPPKEHFWQVEENMIDIFYNLLNINNETPSPPHQL